MKQLNEHDAELLSALADGRLEGDAFSQAVAVATDTPEGRATWHAYHVVGDVLRSTELADGAGDVDFVLRLRARLQAEQQLAPAMPLQADSPAVVAAPGEVGPALQPARVASNTRWKLVAGLASVVAVAALGWQWSATSLAPLPAAQSVRSDAPVPAVAALSPATSQPPAPVVAQAGNAGAAPVMLRDPRLDELLAAHRQFGGTSALQMPAGFLRNATFERPER